MTHGLCFPSPAITADAIGRHDMRILTTLLLAATAMTVSGCAAPSQRISTGLQRYGLDSARADCVGRTLSSDLSIGQLQQLGQAAAAYRKGDTTPGALTLSDLVRVAGEIRDPAIPLAVVKAGAACNVTAAAPAGF